MIKPTGFMSTLAIRDVDEQRRKSSIASVRTADDEAPLSRRDHNPEDDERR
jgi:hypothetical protein